MDISKRNKLNIESRWRKIQNKEKRYIERNAERYPYLKARIFGYLAGDGNIYEGKTKTNRHNSARFFPDHPSLLKPFCNAFKLVYRKRPLVYKKTNFYCVTVDSKIIIQDIIIQARFSVKRWRVPFNLLIDDFAKKEWLRAFFDCEAYICKDHIKIQTVNKQGMLEIKSLLEEFGVQSNYHTYTPKNERWYVNHILFIFKEGRQKYLETIGFNHALKQDMLKNQKPFK